MKIGKWMLAAAGVMGAAVTGAWAQGLPSQKVLTLDVAQTIAQEAMATCWENGYHVTVAVVDSGNFLKALLRNDGATLATIEVAKMKAYTVIMNGGNPSGPRPDLPAGQPVPPPILAGTVNLFGGVPIKVGDRVIGAVAVSGAPMGDKDAACANAALEKVADKLQ